MAAGCASNEGGTTGEGDSSPVNSGLFSASEPRLVPTEPVKSRIHGSMEVSVSGGYRDLNHIQLASNESR